MRLLVLVPSYRLRIQAVPRKKTKCRTKSSSEVKGIGDVNPFRGCKIHFN